MEASLPYSIKEMTYQMILKNNLELSRKTTGEKKYNINILSNITVNPIKEILEFSIRQLSYEPVIKFGNYDNIIQDSFLKEKTDVVIVFYELINFSENFYIEAELMGDDAIAALILQIKNNLNIILHNLSDRPLVLFNKFSPFPITGYNYAKRNIDFIAYELNSYTMQQKPANTQLIDIDRILVETGIKNSIDTKKFFKYKLLYTIDFLKAYVYAVEKLFFSNTGKLKKALIFDCDNTLWKGILGEEGPQGIEMSGSTEAGSHFQLVQKIAVSLSKKGVLICLCSKNNPGEVEEVLNNHPDMILRNEHIVAVKANWKNKTENIKALSKELNIGLDTFVFIDDSKFEISLVQNVLPEVVSSPVPPDLRSYPFFVLDLAQRYFNLDPLKEDLQKVQVYKEQAQREIALSNVSNIDSYLSGLQTKLRISKNNRDHVARAAQLTQKTNQFNVTTIRYAETEILQFVQNPESAVFTVDVSDKFGDSGITGLAILKEMPGNRRVIEIDSFLLSCRVLGRKIEEAFLHYLMNLLKKLSYETLTARYIKTNKNEQVKNFFKDHQFCETYFSETESTYSFDLTNYNNTEIRFIEIIEN